MIWLTCIPTKNNRKITLRGNFIIFVKFIEGKMTARLRGM